MAAAKLEHGGDNDVEKGQAIKEGSKQAVVVNEPSWREDEKGLQSVAFRAWPQ
jgi:hypothetical protein